MQDHHVTGPNGESLARGKERDACIAFLTLLADIGAYDADTLRRVAGHLKEREKWEKIIAARVDGKKPLPWESSDAKR